MLYLTDLVKINLSTTMMGMLAATLVTKGESDEKWRCTCEVEKIR
jgi:hypothetical protein